MTVRELNRGQLAQLKTDYYIQRHGEGISLDEICEIDNIVSDDEVYEHYCDVCFTVDDFF